MSFIKLYLRPYRNSVLQGCIVVAGACLVGGSCRVCFPCVLELEGPGAGSELLIPTHPCFPFMLKFFLEKRALLVPARACALRECGRLVDAPPGPGGGNFCATHAAGALDTLCFESDGMLGSWTELGDQDKIG